MIRSSIARVCSFVLGLALVVAPCTLVRAAANAARPNIVFILIDDLRWDEIGCAGHPFAKTPNIDRIAKEGAYFTNAFVTTPLCSPSRASFLTGRYAHSHNIRDNTDNDARAHELVTYPRLLHDSGYQTCFIGKWHMGTSDRPRPGFDRWVSFHFNPRGDQMPFHNPEINVDGKAARVEGYITDIFNEHALQFVKRQHEKPFLLYLAHVAVHPEVSIPFEQPQFFVPADRHKNLYADKPVPHAPSVRDTLEGKPALQRKIGDFPPLGPDTGTPDETVRNRQRMLAAAEEGVGQLFKALEETRQLDNTLIVFTSDNGYFYGEHGLSDVRRLAYEESIRIPLLVRYPRLIKAGTKLDAIALNIDMAPTMLDLAGVAIPRTVQGRSLLPLFKGDTSDPRRSFLIEYFTDTVRARMPNMGYHAVRTERWKYIRYTDLKDMDELYDLKADPYEMKNRIKDEAAQPALREMRTELERLLHETR